MNVYDVESLKVESDEGTTASVNTVAAIEVGATVPVETDTVVIGMAGQTWESTVAGNVWEPGAYGWEVV